MLLQILAQSGSSGLREENWLAVFMGRAIDDRKHDLIPQVLADRTHFSESLVEFAVSRGRLPLPPFAQHLAFREPLLEDAFDFTQGSAQIRHSGIDDSIFRQVPGKLRCIAQTGAGDRLDLLLESG